ncbi:hypothetical protein NAF17_03930 [Mucilaginibacter sp. RB4R14]|uniref:hypothetical protein n=1 Tax=Mucilaginibacter aurantiaciroseus TaxID=2949308 RepID=UPI002090235B|nr:hypothetical protein [Mucilaginibacter aurantiaciroseus]MCO5934681.1 hypothetical protein [Mucilaginibacter aurantiaciroseus]
MKTYIYEKDINSSVGVFDSHHHTCFCAGTKQKFNNCTLDGMHWQEIFCGADTGMMKSAFTKDNEKVRKRYWSATVTSRRKLIFLFLWMVIDKQGQIYDNRDIGNKF